MDPCDKNVEPEQVVLRFGNEPNKNTRERESERERRERE